MSILCSIGNGDALLTSLDRHVAARSWA